jgi:hypothetical protein
MTRRREEVFQTGLRSHSLALVGQPGGQHDEVARRLNLERDCPNSDGARSGFLSHSEHRHIVVKKGRGVTIDAFRNQAQVLLETVNADVG